VLAFVGAFGAVGIAVALVNAAKEKFGMAILALFIWPAGIGPAARLAKPHSLWAKKLYRGDKLERSRARYPAGAGEASGPVDDAPPASGSSEGSGAGQSSS